MKRSGLLFLAIIIAVGGILVFSSMFTVRQDQQALVLQFGSPVEVERTPGLKFKIPFIQNVEYYDRRILDLDPPPKAHQRGRLRALSHRRSAGVP